MKKFQKKYLNNRGSALQIVLITFMVMTFALTAGLSLIRYDTSNYHKIDLLMKQKNLEIMLVNYFVDQTENDILLSDEYQDENIDIYYTVDDLGDYYEIISYIELYEIKYSFIVQVDVENYKVKKLEYKEA